MEVQDDQLHCHAAGVEIVQDELASNHLATVQTAPGAWSLQYSEAGWLQRHPKVRVYASLRLDGQPDAAGPVMRYGVYDRVMIQHLSNEAIDAESLAGNRYAMVDLGVHDLRNSRYLWTSSVENEKVDRVLIDRFVMVAEYKER